MQDPKKLEVGFEALPCPSHLKIRVDPSWFPRRVQRLSRQLQGTISRALPPHHLHQGASNPAHFPLPQQISGVMGSCWLAGGSFCAKTGARS